MPLVKMPDFLRRLDRRRRYSRTNPDRTMSLIDHLHELLASNLYQKRPLRTKIGHATNCASLTTCARRACRVPNSRPMQEVCRAWDG
jgi:hypothetical protein